jgi:phosphoribosylformimino-5-aminoimidazole carboxamide ribotide isomerase
LILVPAIDIRGGKVVRLKQGRVQDEVAYGSDPAEAARRWQAQGARRLHLVDLDAAIDRRPQTPVVEAVIRAVTIPVEVGGGLRSLEQAMRYRQAGADRVIFGTAALADPGVVQEALKLWPEAVAVAVDARRGRVSLAGWKEISSIRVDELAERVKSWGVVRIQYTDVSRDGTLRGPNIAGVVELAKTVGLRISAAGGISSLEDLVRLREASPFVDEAIVGKALYEGRFTLAEAEQALAR